MKNFTITESEKKEIKQLYGVLNEDQNPKLFLTNGNIQIGDTIYSPYAKVGLINIPVTVKSLKPLGGNNGYELQVDSGVKNITTTISKKRVDKILLDYKKGKPDEIKSDPDTEDGKTIILKKKVK
jgi:hypothetical protein